MIRIIVHQFSQINCNGESNYEHRLVLCMIVLSHETACLFVRENENKNSRVACHLRRKEACDVIFRDTFCTKWFTIDIALYKDDWLD